MRMLFSTIGFGIGASFSTLAWAQGVVAPAAPAPKPHTAAVQPAVATPPVATPAAPGAAPAPAGSSGFVERALPDRAPTALEGIEPVAGGLTADETARRILAASASVKEKRAQVEAASEKIEQTMIQFFPRVTLLASYTRLSPVTVNFGSGGYFVVTGTPGPVANVGNLQGISFAIPSVLNNYSVGARASIPLSDYLLRVSDAAASSSATRRAAELNLEAEKLKVQTDARALYFNWLRARASVSIAQKALESTRARLQDARSAFAVGTISKGDLLRVEAAVANSEVTLTRAQSMLGFTVGQMAILMDESDPKYTVGEGVPAPEQVQSLTATLDQMIAQGQVRRMEMQAVNAAVEGYKRGAKASRGGALPHVDAVGDVTYANPNPRYFPPNSAWNLTWSAGVQATWTIGDTFLNSSVARELEANGRATEAQRIALKAGIATDVLNSYQEFIRAKATFESQRTALASAAEAYRVTTDLFRAGRATTTDLILAENGLLDAKLGDVNARIDLIIASIGLRHAMGEDVPQKS